MKTPRPLTLGTYPHTVLRVECSKRGRSGRFNRDRLIAEHGPDIPLPDLRHCWRSALAGMTWAPLHSNIFTNSF